MPQEYEDLVKKLKNNPEIDNPYALAHYILNKSSSIIDLSSVKTAKMILKAQKLAVTQILPRPVFTNIDNVNYYAFVSRKLLQGKAGTVLKLASLKDYKKKTPCSVMSKFRFASNLSVLRIAAEFEESKHPRDSNGQFTCKECGKSMPISEKESHGKTHEQKKS